MVGVDKPIAGSTPGVDFAALFRLRNHAMATSGNYRNQVKIGEQVIGHTLDPRSGLPVENSVLSATVIAADCRTADALATALMVLGADEGMRLIDAMEGVESLILVDSPSGPVARESASLSLHRLTR